MEGSSVVGTGRRSAMAEGSGSHFNSSKVNGNLCSMPKIISFLTFNDQAEEAAKFYTSIFPNSRITSIMRYPKGAPAPEGSVMTVSFELDGREFVALNGGPQFSFSQGFSI